MNQIVLKQMLQPQINQSFCLIVIKLNHFLFDLLYYLEYIIQLL